MTGEASDPGAEAGRRGKKKGGKNRGGEGEPVDTRTPEQIEEDRVQREAKAKADHAEHIATAQRLAQLELDKRKKEAAARDEAAAEELKNDSILRNLNPVARSDKFPLIKPGRLFNASSGFNDRVDKKAIKLTRPAFAMTGLIPVVASWIVNNPPITWIREAPGIKDFLDDLFNKEEK
jgi:hypothetical protein